MPGKPLLPHPGAKTGTFGFQSPEEEELARKREELQQLLADLAESELDLATFRSELVAFERKYLEVVGSRYAEIDRLEAQIAEALARRNPKDPSARQKADAAHSRAQESAEAMGDVGAKPSARAFEPSEELKALYRQAAKELHPDLTTDPHQRERRQRAMAELNRAYEECDIERIRQILDQWRSSPEHVRGDDTAAQLVRVIREIAQVRKRLDAIKTETEELRDAELSRLKRQVEEAAARGQDLLAEIAGQLDARIAEARARLKEVSKIAELRARSELSASPSAAPENPAEPSDVSPERPPHRPSIRELKAAAQERVSAAIDKFLRLYSNSSAAPATEPTTAESRKPPHRESESEPPATPSRTSRIAREGPEELLRQGNGYLRNGDFEQAAACYTQAIQLKPDFAEAYRNRGFTHVRGFDNVVADHTEALRLRPDLAEAYCDQVNTFSESIDYDVAIAVNTRTIIEEPENGLARYNRGHCYELKGSLDKAIADYTYAIRLDPTYAETYCGRGRAYKKKGNYPRAIADYTRAIQVAPGYAVAYCSRGLAYEAKGDYDQAIADYSEAIRLNRNSVLVYFCRSNAYKKRGELDRKDADITNVLELASRAIEDFRRNSTNKPASYWTDVLETMFGPLQG